MSVNVDYRLIGERIRAHRREQNLTQEVLAEHAGISHKFLGNLERGKGIPSLKTVLSLCEALAVDPGELLLGTSESNPDAPCTLRSDPLLVNTLTSMLIQEKRERPEGAPAYDPDAFPLVDITLLDISETL